MRRGKEDEPVNTTELDTRIATFLERKDAKFPHIGLINRDESRTVKFPMPHRLIHGAH